jgi:carboxyl-terminal processing protease
MSLDPASPDTNPSPDPSPPIEPVATPSPPPGTSAPAYDVRIGPVWGPRSSRRTPVVGLALALVAVLAGSALFMAGFSLGVHRDSQPGTPSTDDQLFKPFWDAYHAITERYAGGSVDKTAIRNGAIKGMFEAIGDPYSSYLTPDQFQETLQGISGQFEGIGAEIGTQNGDGTTSDCSTLGPNCRLVVIAPIEGSPAQKAGLKAGDLIVGVDGSTLDGLTVDGARDKIRGKRGTSVKLSVVRDKQAPFDLAITRDVIVQREVITRTLEDGKVGYVRLTGFSDTAATAFHDAVAKDVGDGITRIVVDLRANPGGFVTAARSVASEFLGSDTIFWQEDAQGNKTATSAQAGGAATDQKIHVVVLIDKGSASASEIVAGALQDTKRATIVGETSFGKGTVQEWTTLEGAGGYRLTIAKWLTPNQRWIHHVGIVPDVPVTVPANNPAGKDPVLDKAVQLLDAEASLPAAA